ncbi:uncharacterized protein LOC110248842 isoform X1 [Exaiptasia diaphana]|uniref:C2H2-type domain-containing protein n=1 Tax=Exaiptasia diaphana TaxID=2652724 RepID=A0A913XWT6_EXADI|nr:uncharacterized protein LOC110248842 isoform X1 [Exaiptasia diaphana]KXJ24195.1 hypothetical protein AC249_AIPGENE4694 [Exaiptasia diaphana]
MISSSWKLCFYVLGMVTVAYSHESNSEEFHCSREGSRVVRSTLRKDFFPVYEQHNLDPNKACPLHEDHDVFIKQELNRIEEHQSRWRCDVCGKVFYGEQYLDMHFDNKHQDLLVKESPVCLADYCDVFRCDFLMDYRRDTFWEKSLCREEKMALLRKRCEKLMHSCLPNGNLLNNTEYHIYESTQNNICSLLTCKNYWKPPHDEISTFKIILYAVFTPFFAVGLIIYYYSAYEYYFGDLFKDSESEMEQHSEQHVRTWQRGGELRNRYRSERLHMY